MQSSKQPIPTQPLDSSLKKPPPLSRLPSLRTRRKPYQRALQGLETWLSGQTLSDALLANYITALHETGKSPAAIRQVVAAVKWQLKYQLQETLNFLVTQATLAGIRRAGKDRGSGQVIPRLPRGIQF